MNFDSNTQSKLVKPVYTCKHIGGSVISIPCQHSGVPKSLTGEQSYQCKGQGGRGIWDRW